ncbi:hypothetical protein G6F57_014579 [Rhizopus arrhizus]|nr:hypothetical protein G6F57_014579 [Rhizopus arrhizus]
MAWDTASCRTAPHEDAAQTSRGHFAACDACHLAHGAGVGLQRTDAHRDRHAGPGHARRRPESAAVPACQPAAGCAFQRRPLRTPQLQPLRRRVLQLPGVVAGRQAAACAIALGA